jgi:deazaflavin-dependent oxidoreductase (nitroreductase family)
MTTTGARSGRSRKAAVAFGWDGERMVVIASKGGAPKHPGWYHNLVANPRVRVQYRNVDEERLAREVVGEERDRLFAQLARDFPNFAAYQDRAKGRRIPVMVLSKT